MVLFGGINDIILSWPNILFFSIRPPSVSQQIFEGVWGQLPDFSTLKPADSGIAPGIGLTMKKLGLIRHGSCNAEDFCPQDRSMDHGGGNEFKTSNSAVIPAFIDGMKRIPDTKVSDVEGQINL